MTPRRCLLRSVWLPLAVLLGACLVRLPAQTLQLADGSVLLAKVEDATGDGLRVKRLDNGGQLDLRWSHLSPDCALRIKQSFNLASTSDDELTVSVHEVDYKHNGSPQVLIGKIVESGNGVVVVQNKGIQYRIPSTEITLLKAIEVPVTQVFTLDEYYTQRLSEVQPGNEADLHIRLAEDLIKVRDYDHAEEHLKKARELNNSRDPKGLDTLSARLQRYKESQQERSLLDDIQTAGNRGTASEFEKGLKLIAKYNEQYATGKGKLTAEFKTVENRFQEARARFLSQQIAEHWRSNIRTVAETKVREPGLTLAAAREYAESKMREDIVAKTAAPLKLEAAEVQSLWQQRDKYPVGKRTELFGYGIGSWVLTEKDIVKGTKQGTAQDKAQNDPEQDRDIQRIAKLIQAGMQRRAAANRGGGQGGAQKEVTDEDWWKDSTFNEKVAWLRAYYAENSGDLKVTSAFLSPCIACYGAGKVPEMGPQGKVQQANCYLCHGTKWTRSFRAY